ncbi:biotin-independent malonate decarboxylase subunit beta [Bordetella bronchialis]|uniref:Biotin-independent malonate decarboxylase subunit beta n=1 Tax=Bordetella bronchialis TaxID=463025 RepID=A0A193G287_9BORD|nr:biotin-independent malonate decarboxylase subunit beta [Bordetella bronchialis]ANN74122.1 biotin-independent malonate decarboxylase subunit beta [Bordetella bronchialis]
MNSLIPTRSWMEASARERLQGLLDAGTFVEFVGPAQRETSPHLALFDLPCAFDDGMIVGRGLLHDRPVWVAAQEGRFMGGTFGEVSGAKLVGLLRAARAAADQGRRWPILLLLDSGGVRLQEANAGELAVSEVIRALLQARRAGLRAVALIGGKAGAFGGAGLVTACCSDIIVSESGRIGVSGPEVIETNRGVEEFDAKDRALVWRVTGGRTRVLTGGADRYARDDIDDFRRLAGDCLDRAAAFDLDTLQTEQARLQQRLARHGDCRDAPEIWRELALDTPESIADLGDEDFLHLVRQSLGDAHVAR